MSLVIFLGMSLDLGLLGQRASTSFKTFEIFMGLGRVHNTYQFRGQLEGKTATSSLTGFTGVFPLLWVTGARAWMTTHYQECRELTDCRCRVIKSLNTQQSRWRLTFSHTPVCMRAQMYTDVCVNRHAPRNIVVSFHFSRKGTSLRHYITMKSSELILWFFQGKQNPAEWNRCLCGTSYIQQTGT